ncbi:MBL fold metallo-hydrolase [Motiliproteus sediminis]|uniref:MBL fold metallo-hydrolase n=1 Tax=Motiliproteus sediminis TaxID=1468178 RepID=UPI0031BA65AB
MWWAWKISTGNNRVAYLTDTFGLPEQTAAALGRVTIDFLIVDCTHPPGGSPTNHNDLTRAIKLVDALRPSTTLLTHISHRMDAWMQANPNSLPANVIAATDDLSLILS